MFQTTTSAGKTLALGQRIGRSLKQNDILALSGELGAGKTTLIQGVAKGLGISNWVTSPTFTLINEFSGRLNMYHVDLYRINHIDEVEDIALEEYFNKGGVTVIEWAEKAEQMLPKGTIKINIKIISENEREFEIEGIKA